MQDIKILDQGNPMFNSIDLCGDQYFVEVPQSLQFGFRFLQYIGTLLPYPLSVPIATYHSIHSQFSARDKSAQPLPVFLYTDRVPSHPYDCETEYKNL